MKHEGAFDLQVSYKGKLQSFGGGNVALMTSTATKKGPIHPTHFAGLLYNVASVHRSHVELTLGGPTDKLDKPCPHWPRLDTRPFQLPSQLGYCQVSRISPSQ